MVPRLVDRQISELLQAADIEAASKDETDAILFLQLLWIIRMNDNVRAHTMGIRYDMDCQSRAGTVDAIAHEICASKAAGNDPSFIEMRGRESACSSAIEARLRGRSWSAPSAAECDLKK